ncbi:flagellar motor protein MotD [Leeia sp.]|uniref:flagellar motor protein MotD n=1 Tax=Leeia sp. TaxID=2884678 RepID=UPI0035B2AE65
MRRHKHEEEHENHERWLVSYADFITLLFAFFVVMYAISQVNEGKYRVLSDSLVQAFQAQGAPNSQLVTLPDPQTAPQLPSRPTRIPPLVQPDPEAQQTTQRMKTLGSDLLKVMQPMINEGQVKVSQTKRGISLEISASVLFAPADARLNPDSVKVLSAVADLLAREENAIQVEGYTDNTPISTPQYPSNWELSSARASSVIRLFVERGVKPDRLSAIGYAENRAKASNADEGGRSKNRRVQVTILAESSDEAASLPAL